MPIVYHAQFYHGTLFDSFESATRIVQRTFVLSKLLKVRPRVDYIALQDLEECRVLNNIEQAFELARLIETAKHMSTETKTNNRKRRIPFIDA